MKAKIQFGNIDEEIGNCGENTGAIIIFRGIVRKKESGKDIAYLHYEAEIDLAEVELKKILEEAKNNFKIIDASAIHRIGDIRPGEESLFVSVLSEHREEGFRCCMFIVDSIKNRLPIWKQDVYEDGTKKWH
ncbi:MAG: molybdenum cofactor biosynthesis protein MoaE [Thermoplasmata archaeon]